MASNASIDSLSDVSSVSMDAGLETGPEAGGEALYDDEHMSAEVATSFEKMTLLTIRRVPVKNVMEGEAPFVFETIKKTTKTLISHSRTPPAQLLNKFTRPGRTSAPNATRREQQDLGSNASTPQAVMHPVLPESSPAPPAFVFRPKIQVFSEEIPNWPKYPKAPPSDLNGGATISPFTPVVNNPATHGQAPPSISVNSPEAPPSWDSAVVSAAYQPPLSTPVPSVSQVAPADVSDRPSAALVTATDPHGSALPHVTFVADAANLQPTSNAAAWASSATASVGSTSSRLAPITSPMRPSARGSQLRRSQIEEALGEK